MTKPKPIKAEIDYGWIGLVAHDGDTLIVVAKNDDAAQSLKDDLEERLPNVEVAVLTGVQQLAVVRKDTHT